MSSVVLPKDSWGNIEYRSTCTNETKLDATLTHLQDQGNEIVAIIPGGMSMEMEIPGLDLENMAESMSTSCGTVQRMNVIYSVVKKEE